jgi:hypothetical protein
MKFYKTEHLQYIKQKNNNVIIILYFIEKIKQQKIN